MNSVTTRCGRSNSRMYMLNERLKYTQRADGCFRNNLVPLGCPSIAPRRPTVSLQIPANNKHTWTAASRILLMFLLLILNSLAHQGFSLPWHAFLHMPS